MSNFEDIVFIGEDTIASASGIHVVFIKLKTQERRIELFDNDERGDGACCLAAHPVRYSAKYNAVLNKYKNKAEMKCCFSDVSNILSSREMQ